MSGIPKRLPCKECGIRPKLIINVLGYSDKDDHYVLTCSKCKKTIKANYDITPKGQENDVVLRWNTANK